MLSYFPRTQIQNKKNEQAKVSFIFHMDIIFPSRLLGDPTHIAVGLIYHRQRGFVLTKEVDTDSTHLGRGQ